MNPVESGHAAASRASDRRLLWVGAVLFFGVGDLITTGIGLGTGTVAEAGPIAGPLFEQYRLAGIFGLKVAILAGSFALYRAIPRRHDTGVPLGLATVGVTVTGWNLLVLLAATGMA